MGCGCSYIPFDFPECSANIFNITSVEIKNDEVFLDGVYHGKVKDIQRNGFYYTDTNNEEKFIFVSDKEGLKKYKQQIQEKT